MASSSEREIRDVLVKFWHNNEPRGRVVHELPLDGFSASGRADLAIIFPDAIVLQEIKSEKDKLTRLKKQFFEMSARCHQWHIVCHEKWFNQDNSVKDQEWCKYSHREHFWKYPDTETWKFDRYKDLEGTPGTRQLLGFLWADELRLVYETHFPKISPRALQMWEMQRDLYSRLSGKQVTLEVCSMLRRRKFNEADAPIMIEDREAA
ncbi:hypothetical protein EGJ57_04550 [Brucella anthropi]|uniref:hypothetical protein n=1 Tax=Brucella anthropi TaxID=529 RepID=UPI000F66B962|nr:hypothetical protein [Brucella anthropi]RRY22043.1 hypothetical protein EGJ57_04550 [Brucella anthropi]